MSDDLYSWRNKIAVPLANWVLRHIATKSYLERTDALISIGIRDSYEIGLHPTVACQLTFEQSMRLIEERYGDAIEQLKSNGIERALTALRVLVGAAPQPVPSAAFEIALNQAVGLLAKADAADDQRKAAAGYHPCGVCDISRELCAFCAKDPP